jgi:hypothetical protein
MRLSIVQVFSHVLETSQTTVREIVDTEPETRILRLVLDMLGIVIKECGVVNTGDTAFRPRAGGVV